MFTVSLDPISLEAAACHGSVARSTALTSCPLRLRWQLAPDVVGSDKNRSDQASRAYHLNTKICNAARQEGVPVIMGGPHPSALPRTMGNLRTYDYDFKALWLSKQAEEARRWIKNNHCHCQLANAHYTNILCDFSMMLKVLWQYLSNGL